MNLLSYSRAVHSCDTSAAERVKEAGVESAYATTFRRQMLW